ncbi:transmembrane protein 106B-like [Orbicella faveolata]|uniref:transmembrane protein 106B-like n=1 Tax=Orbicella faveolata TaxID=48498 RepID=UPI0009E53DC4|nr:transmembrane protein 106B-like [Orbicella faveolata]
MLNETDIADMMSRWFRKYTRKNEMTAIGNNILSDPTSDGNFSTTDNDVATERPSSPVYSYEEFGDRMNPVNSDQSLTQTCPTCGGTGRLTKEQEHDLVALIPVRDSRLRPRRTVLYLLVAVFLCLTVCTVVAVIFFPRSISIKLVSASPKNISIPKANETDPFIIINCTTLIKNDNFFEAHLDNMTVQVNWNNYVVADPDMPGTIKVPARSSLNVC